MERSGIKPFSPSVKAALLQQSRKLFQSAGGFVQHIGAAGKVHPDQVVHRLPEETGTGHSSHADLTDHPLAELKVCPAGKLRQGEEIRDVDHDKVGALRGIVLQPCPVQPGQKMIALFGVERLQMC